MKFRYLSLEHVLSIHDLMIREFGGSHGLRDSGLLESSIGQPRQSFGGIDLYPTLFEKAAMYAYSISENQPFIDGNKRTAASVAAIFLELNGFEIDCPEGQIYGLMMDLANKRISRKKLSKWFKDNSKKISNRQKK